MYRIRNILLFIICIVTISSAAFSLEERYATVDPEIVKLVELHPGEIVIRKREHLVGIGMKKASEWSDSAVMRDIEEITDYILNGFARYGGDFEELSGRPEGRVRRPVADPVLSAIAVAAMLHNIPGAQGFVFQYVRRDHLHAFSEYTKTRLYEKTDGKFLYIANDGWLRLCNFSQQEKDSLLSYLDEHPRNLGRRAFLGDTSAETELIRRFTTADNYREKMIYLPMLSMARTENTIRTMVESLTCTLFTEGYSSRQSIRLPILRLLGGAFPQEPLFKTVPHMLAQRWTDRHYPKEEIIQYMEDLKQWAWDTLNIELDFDEETFYINAFLGDIYPDFHRDGLFW